MTGTDQMWYFIKMKIELRTKKGDVNIELFTEIDRLKFAESLPRLVTPRDFIFAVMSEEEGDAKFDKIESLLIALKNYED